MANTKLKRAARARQEATGERYTTALARVLEDYPMSEAKNDPVYSVAVYSAVEKWLKSRRFRTVRNLNRLLFSEANHPSIYDFHIASSPDSQQYLSLSYPYLKPSDDGATVTQVTQFWTEGCDECDEQSAVDLAMFALETLFPGRQPAPEPPAPAEIQLRAALDDLRRANERAINAERRLGEVTGSSLPKFDGVPEEAGQVLQIWSTYKFSCRHEMAHTMSRLFYCPLGQIGQGFESGLTISDTNLKEGGRVPAGFGFLVKKAMVEIFGDAEDVKAVRANGVIRWDFTQKGLMSTRVIRRASGPPLRPAPLRGAPLRRRALRRQPWPLRPSSFSWRRA